MAQVEPIKSHVIRRIFNMSRKKGNKPVTLRDIYATSSRARDDIEAALYELVQEGIVVRVHASFGMGRPTYYFYLKNKWEHGEGSFFKPPSDLPLVDTGEPNPHTTPDRGKTPSETAEAILEEMQTDDIEEYFNVIGPRIWLHVHEREVTQNQLTKHFLGSEPNKEDRRKFIITLNRLMNKAYDEYYTKWWIKSVTTQLTSDGRKSKKYENKLFTNDDIPAELKIDQKKVEQEKAQRRTLRSPNVSAESMHFPEPSDELPDMTRFAAMVRALRG